MVEYLIQEETLIAIADAIRAKINGTNLINPKDMPTAIETIGCGNEKPFDCHSVTFMCGDTVLYVRSVADGDTCADPVSRGLISAPTKESTAQYDYTYYGWGASDGGAADANILKNITEDKTVYAIFTATVRYYTITYYDEDGTTVLHSESLAYGATPSYIPTKKGAAFESWTPTPAAVTGDTSYTVVWGAILTLENSTWSQIKSYLTSGEASTYFAPGDTKTVTTSDGQTVVFEFNRFMNSGKMLFVTKYLSPFSSNMNSSNSYPGSAMKKQIDTFIDTLPSDMQSVMAYEWVSYNMYSFGYDTDYSQNLYKMWVPSLKELGFSQTNDSSHPLDVSGGIIKKISEDATSGSQYYTRSWGQSDDYVYIITADGKYTLVNRRTDLRAPLCFVIEP